jgi:hypothetical protein
MMPAWAPCFPASNDPAVLTTRPFSNSFLPEVSHVALPVLGVPERMLRELMDQREDV